jgi:exodeoxyribonuclease V gamma subunit
LDLRAAGRQAGDVDRREQDLYMFLETLLSARDHVVLSYVARDEITGDDLPSSPVLLELRSMMAQGYLAPAQLAELFGDDLKQRPPLRRFDDSERRRAVLPAAEAEHQAKVLGARLAKGEAGLAPARAACVPVASASDPAATVVVPLATLRRFLEDPLQGSARFRLGMRDDDERASADVEDEPFDMDKRGSSYLVRASMTDAILAAQAVPPRQDLLAAYQRRSSRAELAGQCPTGLFRAAGVQVEQEVLRTWHEELPKLLGQRRAECRVIRLAAHAHQPSARRESSGVVYCPAPSFTLPLPGGAGAPSRVVRLGGQTGLCALLDHASDATLAFTCRAGISGKEMIREELGAFLDYVVLTAAGAEPARASHRSALFFTKNGHGKLRTLVFRPLERERARDYLARLCADLLTGALDAQGASTGVHPYLLPHEAVFESQRKQAPIVDAIDDLCAGAESDDPVFSSLRGPVPRVLERYAPPDAGDAERMVQARFGLFFELAREEDP